MDALPGPLRGAEQRRGAGGFRLALSEPQASLASRPAHRVAQGTGAAGTDPGVAFSLLTFFWRSKRKCARWRHGPGCRLRHRRRLDQSRFRHLRSQVRHHPLGHFALRAARHRRPPGHRYFQSAERIDAARAREIGLVHEVVEPEQLDAKVQEIVAPCCKAARSPRPRPRT
jgi:hypothetical protein